MLAFVNVNNDSKSSFWIPDVVSISSYYAPDGYEWLFITCLDRCERVLASHVTLKLFYD